MQAPSCIRSSFHPAGDNRKILMTIRLADCDGQRVGPTCSSTACIRGADTEPITVPTAPNCVIFTATSADDVIGR